MQKVQQDGAVWLRRKEKKTKKQKNVIGKSVEDAKPKERGIPRAALRRPGVYSAHWAAVMTKSPAYSSAGIRASSPQMIRHARGSSRKPNPAAADAVKRAFCWQLRNRLS